MALTTAATTTGRPEIDALIVGTRWADPNLTYGFASGQSDYGSGYTGGYPSTARALGAAQQAAFRDALGEWSAVANVTFSQVAASAATVRIAATPAADTAFAFLPATNQEGGDVWIGTDIAGQAATPGSYAYMTYVHELGHVLGLGHPHEAAVNPGITDQISYSVMSYRSYLGAPLTGYTVADGSFASSPMISDIAAVQAIYGANFASHAGADTYRWTPGATVFETVWDGGGTDTYDLSNFATNLVVDLNPGAWSYFGTGLADLGNGQHPPGNVANALLYNGDTRSLIENAVGGSGHDLIAGNVAANDLNGGAGNDTIFGAGGGDVLHGGAGNDVIYGGTGYSDPTDGADTIFGEGGDDLIYGNAGSDLIDAGQGSATVYGGYGLDTISAEMTPNTQVFLYGGGASNDPTDVADTLTLNGNVGTIMQYGFQPSFAQLFGNGGDDRLTVNVAGDLRAEIYGGFGNDLIRVTQGGTFANALIVGGPGGDDIAVSTLGNATIYGGSGATDPTDVADRIDASGVFGRAEIYGNGGNDTIIAGHGENTIHGGAGDDLIVMNSFGRNVLYGDGGNDTFVITRFSGSSAMADQVADFGAGDKLDLDTAGAGARFAEVAAAVTDAAQALAAAAGAFAGGALYVAVKSATDTFLFADYDGDKSADWSVKLTGFTGHLDPATVIV